MIMHIEDEIRIGRYLKKVLRPGKHLKRSLIRLALCLLVPLNAVALELNKDFGLGEDFSSATSNLQALPKTSFFIVEAEECMAGYQSASAQFFPKNLSIDGLPIYNISFLSDKRKGVLVSVHYSVLYSEENLSRISQYFNSKFRAMSKLDVPKKLRRDDKYVSSLYFAETSGGEGYLAITRPTVVHKNVIQNISLGFYAKGYEWIATKNVGARCDPNSEE
jgi:hypothetical protein